MTIFRCATTGTGPGIDTFQFGLHLLQAGGNVEDAVAAYAAAVDLLWNGDGDTVSGVSQYYSADTVLQSHVATALDPSTGKNTSQALSPTSLAGTGVTEALPGEVALCVSTRTGVPTRAGRGRFFLPAPAVATMSAGIFSNSLPTDAAAGAAAALNSLITAGYPAVIYHSSTLSFTAISSVDCGNVPDVQRRRRNKLVESRYSQPVG
jgi:hypothetical protein